MSVLDFRPARVVEVQTPFAEPARPALVDHLGCLSHAELTARVDAVAAQLPPVATGRRLVHVPLTAERALVVGYLAVLAAGHVALVTPTGNETVPAVYPPDLTLRADGRFEAHGDEPRHLLHPDLALLLSTSGSTGSPKLVRLSAENLLSNADAIAAALAITAEDRAITSLPLHYCFGLSVLHAQLRAGATTVLRPGSVLDPGFGDDLVRHRVSLLAATPHVIDLLDDQGVLDQELPDLRLLMQAGGGLGAERVAALAQRGSEAGWRLAVMYGQTEATARIAVLPPELAQAHPGAVGWPIAGSSVRLDDAGLSGLPEGVGELVFRGPGVMLGYAEHPDELALGRMVDELRTGDLARLDDAGLIRIVGRRADFVKIAGLRIDLGQVERTLRAAGLDCRVTGTDDGLQVTVVGTHAHPARLQAAEVSGLSPSVISVRRVEGLPVLPNGKPDRRGCAALHAPSDDAETAGGDLLARISAALAPLTTHGRVEADRSFAELGGDSFNHVQASLRLGRVLGELPPDWHHRPVRALAALGAPTPARRRWWQPVETTVVLRGVAALTICGSHIDLFPLAGGAHVLFAVAGFLFAAYVLTAPSPAELRRRTGRALVAVAVPALAVFSVLFALFGSVHWSHLALVHWLVQPHLVNGFWFIEALLIAMVVSCAALLLPRVGAAFAADPWRTAMIGFGLLLVPRYLVLALMDGPMRIQPYTVGWLFAAGAAMSLARTGRQRWITAAAASVATIGFYPSALRDALIILGLVLLAVVPSIPVPRPLVRPLGVLAAASLHLYLVQFQVFSFFSWNVACFVAAIAVGVGFWALTRGLGRPSLALGRLRRASAWQVRP